MPIQLFRYPESPNDIGVTKIDVLPNECAFFLDFQRPLEKMHWLGVLNRWLGPTVSLMVPVAHLTEKSGGYVIAVQRSEPYFGQIQQLWQEHDGAARAMISKADAGLSVIAEFGMHFPEDCS